MDPIKSVAIAPTRRRAGKPRPAGHPAPTADSRVAGQVGPGRRAVGRVEPAGTPLYHIGQRLTLLGGGNHWARPQGQCRVLAVLPHENGPFLYRVRSELESYERVVVETDLAPAP